MPTDDKEECGVGILTTGPDDPFVRACRVHDARYVDNETGTEYEKKTRREWDNEFCRNLDRIIRTREFLAGRELFWLRRRAAAYKWIVKNLGGLVW